MERVSLNQPTAVSLAIGNLLHEYPQIKHNKLYVTVEVTVQGVPVSFERLIEHLHGVLQTDARTKAIELLETDAALAGIRRTLLGAQAAISAAVNKLATTTPGEKEGNDEVA